MFNSGIDGDEGPLREYGNQSPLWKPLVLDYFPHGQRLETPRDAYKKGPGPEACRCAFTIPAVHATTPNTSDSLALQSS